ncbi:MAG: trypsin-like peptidase domain-containing protein [Rhodobacteraceae bacterium]|nr:trypsin-like peptidase domain-containing protein [Paracoccaceae bacterium]
MVSIVPLTLLAGGRSGLFSGRVGSIISRNRRAIPLTADRIPAGTVPPAQFEALFPDLCAAIARAAPSVGRIECLRGDGSRQVLATCFRVGNDPARVATARHVGALLVQARARVAPGLDPPVTPAFRAALRDLRVVFEPSVRPGASDPPAAGDLLPAEERRIAAIELSHGELDLMLLRLDAPSGRDPLPLGAPLDPAAGPAICVLGYPVAGDGSALFAEAFDVGGVPVTGIKRASPGRVQAAATALDLLHDATTLPGSSGSPVLSLPDGGLVGLHYAGIRGTDPNRMIHLPAAFALEALRERFDPQAGPPRHAFPPWPATEANRIVGKTLHEDWTAEEHVEVAPPGAEDGAAGVPSAVPDHIEWSPAVLTDRRDIRDRYYVAPLRDPLPQVLPAEGLRVPVLEQGATADCTGCALAVAVELALLRQNRREADGSPIRVSRRMLYEMARLHDEFVDDLPGGSSLRGAIKAFYHNGVCRAAAEDAAPAWHLSVERARQAREIALGAYYRLRPSLPDFQMAIQETGAVVISAWTHAGWTEPVGGRILRSGDRRAAHAFVLIGYDAEGFLIQNSWGAGWSRFAGLEGVAHWSYADWAENVIDAWVLQTAPPAPGAHNLPLRAYQAENDPAPADLPAELAALPEPRRMAIIGHVAHAERMGLVDAGRIGVGPRTIRETALFLGAPETWRRPDPGAPRAPRGAETGNGSTHKTGYGGIAFLFHDPVLGPEAMARLAAHLVPRFKAAGIYPLNILYGADEIRSLTARMQDEARTVARRAGAQEQDLTAWLDRRARVICRTMLEGFLDGIEAAAAPGGAIWRILAAFGYEAVLPPPDLPGRRLRRVHLVAFGLGALAAEAGLRDMKAAGFADRGSRALRLASVSLVAPVTRAADPFRAGGAAGGATRVFDARLGPARPRGLVLPGYAGDWCDLVAAMLGPGGLRPRAEGGPFDRVHALAGLVTDGAVLNGILRTVTGREALRPEETFPAPQFPASAG